MSHNASNSLRRNVFAGPCTTSSRSNAQNGCLPHARTRSRTRPFSAAASDANLPCGLDNATGRAREQGVVLAGEPVEGVAFGHGVILAEDGWASAGASRATAAVWPR